MAFTVRGVVEHLHREAEQGAAAGVTFGVTFDRAHHQLLMEEARALEVHPTVLARMLLEAAIDEARWHIPVLQEYGGE